MQAQIVIKSVFQHEGSPPKRSESVCIPFACLEMFVNVPCDLLPEDRKRGVWRCSESVARRYLNNLQSHGLLLS